MLLQRPEYESSINGRFDMENLTYHYRRGLMDEGLIAYSVLVPLVSEVLVGSPYLPNCGTGDEHESTTLFTEIDSKVQFCELRLNYLGAALYFTDRKCLPNALLMREHFQTDCHLYSVSRRRPDLFGGRGRVSFFVYTEICERACVF